MAMIEGPFGLPVWVPFSDTDLRNMSAPYWNPNQPTGGQQGPLDIRSSAQTRESAASILEEEFARGGLTPADHQVFADLIAQSERPGGPPLTDVIDQIRTAGERGRTSATREEARTDVLGRLGDIEGRFLPQFEQQFQNVRGLYDIGSGGTEVLNLGRVRQSGQYGAALAAAENAINADITQGRRMAQTAQVSRGVSSSGKLGSLVRGVESQGAEAKGRLQAGIASDIQGNYNTAQDRLLGFQTNIANARNAANIGDIEASLAIQGGFGGSNFFGPQATGLDASALRLGQERADLGLALNFIQSLMSQGQQAANTGVSLLSSAIPGGG